MNRAPDYHGIWCRPWDLTPNIANERSVDPLLTPVLVGQPRVSKKKGGHAKLVAPAYLVDSHTNFGEGTRVNKLAWPPLLLPTLEQYLIKDLDTRVARL